MIEYASYYLKLPQPKNSRDDSLFSLGHLVRVLDSGVYGYADFHPHKALGDLSWEESIELKNTQFIQSLAFAKKDAQARVAKKSLKPALNVRCHQIDSDRLSAKQPVKLKVGRNPKIELQRIEELSKGHHSLRLDFNASLELSSYQDFLKALSPKAISAIEFVEDPIPYREEDWKALPKTIPIALDNEEKSYDWFKDATTFDVLIIKPAKKNAKELIAQCEKRNIKFVFTHYMDHIVGLRHAQVVAAGFMNHPLCLNYHGLNAADWQWGELTPQWDWSGYGIGLESQLRELAWQRL